MVVYLVNFHRFFHVTNGELFHMCGLAGRIRVKMPEMSMDVAGTCTKPPQVEFYEPMTVTISYHQ